MEVFSESRGKKKLVGKVNVDAGQGVWPQGEWVPTEPIEDALEIMGKEKSSKFAGATGIVAVSYYYGGASETSLRCCYSPHVVRSRKC